MTNVETAIPADMRAQIEDRLDRVERSEDVRLLFVIESGSRAWGFPSPDSDFDVRFVYVRKPDWYLSIFEERDVIELPIEGDLDINGWDLKKALQLLIKPNPVLLEWMRSPIVYRMDESATARLLALGEKTLFQRPSAYHYANLAGTQYRRFIQSKDAVPLKKYFYALRPVLALMWLRTHPGSPVPMNLRQLRDGLDLRSDVSDFLDDMLAKKAVAKELGTAPRVDILDRLIEAELDLVKDTIGEAPAPSHQLVDDANALFRDLVRENA